MNMKDHNLQFLDGGGEMGELTRTKDWSKTPVGSFEQWPQSLRTTLGIMLYSKFPMFLFWGPELTCFYNDAYRPSLGNDGKHPAILGSRAEDFWQEIWSDIKPLIDQVLAGGVATWSEDQLLPIYRNGKMEDVYWTFSYSPVSDESGKPAGVFVTCTETTEKVNTVKRLELSNQRYHNNIMQAPVAMCIFRGEDHVVEIANGLMLEIWGKQAGEVMEKPIFEGLPEAKGQGLEILLDNVYTTGERYSAIERPVDLPRENGIETTYINFIYEALTEVDGTISGIVATASEVTEQVKARKALEEREQRVRALVKNTPFPMAVYAGREMRIELANQSIMDIWGKGPDVIGKLFTEVVPELDNQLVFKQIVQVFETGTPFHTQNTPLDLVVDGKLRTYYFNYSFTPLYDADGKVYGVMNTGADVTDLNLAKKQTEESDKRFRNTVKQAPMGITILRGDQYIVEMANDAYLQVVDRTAETFIGRPLFDSLPEVEESVHSLLDDVMKTGIPFHGIEYPIPMNRYGKQEMSFFDFLYHPLREEDGTISGIMATVNDVTEKTEARKKVELAEERLRLATESTGLSTWALDFKTMELMYSPSMLDIFEVNEDGILTQEHIRSQMHPVDVKEIVEKAFELSLQTGICEYETRVIKSDGSIVWIRTQGKVFFDEEHKPVKIVGTLRDITEEKNSRQELLESEQKFRLLADSMPQHIWTSDPEGNLNYFNQSVFSYSGLSPEQLDKVGWLDIVHPDDREENIHQWKEAITTGNDFLIEHRFRRHDGEYHWQLSRAIPQRDAAGKIQMWVGTSTDIQEQKTFVDELEKQVYERTCELEEKNTELEQINKELQSFAYISSHDLQEPLRKIQTFSSRIVEKEYENLSENGKDYFKRMQLAAKRMQTLIEDLLAYSRTSTDQRKFEQTKLAAIVEEVKDDLSEELLQHHATITVGIMCEAMIIPFQFRQLVYNLFSNSLKFSREGIDPQINIQSVTGKGKQFGNPELAEDGIYCHVCVSDNGIGFEAQYSEKIFEVFQRLHGRNEYHGTGIGLAIVKKIVENHGGKISAKGETGKGATFDIYLPINEV